MPPPATQADTTTTWPLAWQTSVADGSPSDQRLGVAWFNGISMSAIVAAARVALKIQ